MKRIFTLAVATLIFMTVHSQAWIEVGTGSNAINANYTIFSLLADPAGNIYAAGGFTNGPVYYSGYSYVTKWNGTTWATVGADSASALNANNSIYSLTQDLSGNIYAAGNFTDIYGQQYVAKWNGTAWGELGIDSVALGATAPIYCITTDPTGNVYAAGDFIDTFGNRYVAKWNGSAWSRLGTDSVNGLDADSTIYALATDLQGNVYAAGSFIDSLGFFYVAKWNGTKWAELGTDSNALHANGAIYALLTDTSGHIYAAGDFYDTLGNFYIAKWNDSTWVELSNPLLDQTAIFGGPIYALTFDSVGHIYAGGMIPDTNGNFFHVVEWDDSMLITADHNGQNPLYANASIQAMTTDKYGNIYAAGQFTDNNDSMYVAEFTYNVPNGIMPVYTDHMSIYPNPTSGIIYINADHLSGTATIEVLDGLGRTLYSQATDGGTIQTSLNMSGFAPGVYTLLIRDASNMNMTKRIVRD